MLKCNVVYSYMKVSSELVRPRWVPRRRVNSAAKGGSTGHSANCTRDGREVLMTRSGVASLAFFLPPSRPPGLRVLMLDKVTNLFDFWTRLPLSASFDDESTASIGPLSSADLAKLDCGEIDLARTCCGIFRHRAIRISFERFQGPQCRRRALWYTAAFLGFQIFLGVLKAAGAPAAGSAMIFSGPWYAC